MNIVLLLFLKKGLKIYAHTTDKTQPFGTAHTNDMFHLHWRIKFLLSDPIIFYSSLSQSSFQSVHKGKTNGPFRLSPEPVGVTDITRYGLQMDLDINPKPHRHHFPAASRLGCRTTARLSGTREQKKMVFQHFQHPARGEKGR